MNTDPVKGEYLGVRASGYHEKRLELTFAHIPTQVPEAVEGVERERCREHDLAGVLDGVR